MQISLDVTGWHRRLQEWTFNDVPRFDNLCPYFWLTSLCLLVSPFVGTWRALTFGFAKYLDVMVWGLSQLLAPFDFAGQWLAERFDPTKEWRHNRYLKNMSESLVYYYWCVDSEANRRLGPDGGWPYRRLEYERKAKQILNAWRDLFTDCDERLARIIDEQKALEQRDLLVAQDAAKEAFAREEARRLFFLKLSGMTQTVLKPVGYLLLVVLALSALGGVGYGAYWVFMNALMRALIIVGVVVATFVAAGIIFVSGRWLNSHDWFGLDEKIIDFIIDHKAWPALSRFTKLCVTPFSIFFLYAKAVLDDNCPGIEWDNENA